MDIRTLIDNDRTCDVEFKENVSELTSDDLVAFANSENGGIILIGVKKDNTIDEIRNWQVIGSEINDGMKLNILDKAQSCRPAINVQISVEELDSTYVYKIHIHSGISKPYCTDSGIYTIRGDGRNQALYPTELLMLFMNNEKNKFVSNCSDNTNDFDVILKESQKGILEEIKSMEANIQENLKCIYDSISSGEDRCSSIEYSLGEIQKTLTDSLYIMPTDECKINDILKSSNIVSCLNAVNYYKKVENTYLEESLLNTCKKAQLNVKIKESLFDQRKAELKRIFPQISEDDLKLFYDKKIYTGQSKILYA